MESDGPIYNDTATICDIEAIIEYIEIFQKDVKYEVLIAELGEIILRIRGEYV